MDYEDLFEMFDSILDYDYTRIFLYPDG